MQKQIRAEGSPEALDGRCVNGNAGLKGPLQLRGHNGQVFLPSAHIAEGQTDELHIRLLHVLHHFALVEIRHGMSPPDFKSLKKQGGTGKRRSNPPVNLLVRLLLYNMQAELVNLAF
jgi:hypothetical protein